MESRIQPRAGRDGVEHDRRIRPAAPHDFHARLAVGCTEGTGVADLFFQDAALHRVHFGDVVDHLLVGATDRLFGAPVQKFVAFRVRQVFRICGLSRCRCPRLELRHVVGKHDVHVLPRHAAQFCDVDEGRQALDAFVIPGRRQLDIRNRSGEGVEEPIPLVHIGLPHHVIHDVAHLVVDFGQGVGDRCAGEDVDAFSAALALHIVGEKPQLQ